MYAYTTAYRVRKHTHILVTRHIAKHKPRWSIRSLKRHSQITLL